MTVAVAPQKRKRKVQSTNRWPGECSRCEIRISEDEGHYFEGPLRLVCGACALREGVTNDNGLARRLAAMPITTSEGEVIDLLPFQVVDCRRIATTRAVLIGSACGTGKTIQAAIAALRSDCPNFVFCPASVRENWVAEILKWRPDMAGRVNVISTQVAFHEQIAAHLDSPGNVLVGSFGVLPGSPCGGCRSLKAKLRKLKKWKIKYCLHCDERRDSQNVCSGCGKTKSLRRDGKPEEGKRQKWAEFCPRCETDQDTIKTDESCLGCGGKVIDKSQPRYFGALHGAGCMHVPEWLPSDTSDTERIESEKASFHPPFIELKIDGVDRRLPYHANGELEAWIGSGIVIPHRKKLPADLVPELKCKTCAGTGGSCSKCRCGGCVQINPQPEIDGPVVLIGDECHAFKTPGRQRTNNWRGLQRRVWEADGYVFGLSGTPCEGKPLEFWEVLVSLGLAKAAFGSFTKTYKRIFHHWFNHQKGDRLPPQGALRDELIQRLRRVQINRRRQDVLSQLPPRTEVVISVEINEQTKHDVNEAVHRMLAVKRSWDDVQAGALHQGTRLLDPFIPHISPDERDRRRMIYESRVDYYFVERPWNRDEEIVEAVDQALMSKGRMPTIDQLSRIRAMLSQAKVAAVKQWVEDREQEDEPVVLFSQHVQILKKISDRPGWECFHGGLSAKKRSEMVKRFQTGETSRGLAVSIGAGGEGITLTRAAVCAFIDLSFNPAKNHQSESRLIRIGAEKHDLKAAEKAIADLGCCVCQILDGKAVPCDEHKTSIVVVRFIAKHVVDQLVMETLKEKEALLASLEWDEEVPHDA